MVFKVYLVEVDILLVILRLNKCMLNTVIDYS
jgi:hypothetical protein